MTNCLLIDKRLNSGLELISKHYDVSEFDVDTVLANPVIGNRPHHARHFDIKGVGNLLMMSVKDADEFASMEPDRFNTIYRAYWQSLYIKNYIGIYSILLSENKKNGIPIYDCALTEDDLDEIRLRYEVISNATKQVDLMHRIHITNPDVERGDPGKKAVLGAEKEGSFKGGGSKGCRNQGQTLWQSP